MSVMFCVQRQEDLCDLVPIVVLARLPLGQVPTCCLGSHSPVTCEDMFNIHASFWNLYVFHRLLLSSVI